MDRDGSYRDSRKRFIDPGLMVSSPSTVKNAENLQRRSNMTPQQIKALRQLDESILYENRAENDFASPFTGRGMARRSRISMIKDNEYSMLAGLSDDELELEQTRNLFEPRTPGGYAEQLQTTLQCLPDEDPGLAATSSLYFDFKHSLQRHESAADVFDLLGKYEEICTDHEHLLRKLLSRTKLEPTSVNLVDMIQNEKRTWRLISCLYNDRLRTEALEGSMVDDDLAESESEAHCVKNLYKGNSDVREAQIIIDWLERNAADDLDDGITEKVQHYSEAVCWENTLHYLSQRKLRGEVGVGDKHIVSQMDPDAPSRQRKPLADLDQSDEIRLLKFMFSFIRAGKIEKAKELCLHCGQPWRVVSLEGWRLYEDRNKEYMTEDGPVEIEGNPLRDLWKLACWTISQDESAHSFERAVYGALCGNLKAMVAVCKSWEDYLWAHFKAMTDTIVEQELRNCPTLLARVRPECNNQSISLPESYWDQKIMLSTPADIFDKILAISNETTRLEAESPFHIIQKHLMLDNISGLVNAAHAWIMENIDGEDDSFERITNIHPQLLRFIAHLVLLLRNIGVEMDEKKCEDILESYVRYLATDERSALLVASYTAALTPAKQIDVYSDFLKTVDDRELRKEYLKMAHEAGLDIPTITKTVVEDIRLGSDVDMTVLAPIVESGDLSASEDDFNPLVESDVTNDDWKKIEALDWLVFDVSQRPEAVKQCNALMRSFLLKQKFTAAKQVMRKIPDGSVDTIYHQRGIQGMGELPPNDENAIREHLCLQEYLAATQAFEDWFKFFNKSKPLPPSDSKSRRTNFASRVAKDHKEEQYQDALKQWENTSSDLCRILKDKVFNVLLFPGGGWLVDVIPTVDEPKNQSRHQQMNALRQTCLPNLCLLLLTALKNTDDMKDQCMHLADVIANEEFKIYEAMKKEDGRKILLRIQDIAVDLL